MQDILTNKPSGEFDPETAAKLTARGIDVTDGDINCAYFSALGLLNSIIEQSGKFAERCAYVGKLLTAKKLALGDGKWTAWRNENCPEIKERTDQRLREIYRMSIDPSHGTGVVALTNQPLASIRAVYEVLLSAETQPENPEKPVVKKTAAAKEKEKERVAIAKVKSAITRFWKAITDRPPEVWDLEEKSEFLTDLAERERIRRKHGWELPVIDIETETLS